MIRQRNIDPDSDIGTERLLLRVDGGTADEVWAVFVPDCDEVVIEELGIACETLSGTSPTADLVVRAGNDAIGLGSPATGGVEVVAADANYQVTGNNQCKARRLSTKVAAEPQTLADTTKRGLALKLILDLGGTTPNFTGSIWMKWRAWRAKDL